MIRRRPPRPPVASIRSRLLRPSLAMTASHLRPLAAACVLAALLFAAAAPAHAQYALRASVAAAGATDASGGGFRLRATAGQPAAGRVTGGAYVLGQGFWYPATLADGGGGPALSVTATPLNPPIVVPAGGGEFRFRVTITNNTGTSQTFQAWIDVLLPNGNPYHVLGPQSLTLGPNQTFGPVTLRQRVPGSAPAGGYVHRVHVGTFPGNPVATGSFPWTKSGAALAPPVAASREPGGEAAARTDAAAARPASAREEANVARAGVVARGRGAVRAAGWLLLLDATGAPVADVGDLALAMPIDAAAEARVTAEVEAARAAREAEAAGEERAEDATEATAEAAPATTAPGAPAHVAEVPSAAALAAPFPNPSEGRTTVRFGLPEAGVVRVSVYDVHGRRVALLVDEARAEGWHEVAFAGEGLASGVYLVRLETGGHVLTRRITLLR